MFVALRKERKGRDIPVRMTVLLVFPATADLRAARVETRTVGPLAPPVVLHANYNVKLEVGNRWIAHTIQGLHNHR